MLTTKRQAPILLSSTEREQDVNVWRDGQAWPLHTEPLAEHVLQQRGTEALAALGFVVKNLSQARETQQPLGIPDTLVYQPACPIGCAWIEWKRPAVRVPGVRPNTWRILKPQGKRSWEQEQLHAEWRASGIRVVTADSVDLALAFLAPGRPGALQRPPRAAGRAAPAAADQEHGPARLAPPALRLSRMFRVDTGNAAGVPSGFGGGASRP
jgi:hypothetical protein